MPVSEDPDWVENAVLVYGPRKGGTTLFQNLLDGGNELFVYPAELKLKYFARTQELSPSEYFAHSKLPGNRSAAASADNEGNWDPASYYLHSREYTVSPGQFDRAGYETAWKQDKSAKTPIAELIRKDAVRVFENCRVRPSQPAMWCAKEVGGRTSEVLELWKKAFPQGRMLLLARDPLMVVRAVLQDRRRIGSRPSIWNIIKQTYEPMAVNTGICQLLGNKDVFAVCYEDLVPYTEKEMRGVARFLGIAYGEFLTIPTMLGENVVVRTSSRVDRKVFVSESGWTDGLTLRERTIVSVAKWALRLWPPFRKEYPRLRQKIGAASAALSSS